MNILSITKSYKCHVPNLTSLNVKQVVSETEKSISLSVDSSTNFESSSSHSWSWYAHYMVTFKVSIMHGSVSIDITANGELGIDIYLRWQMQVIDKHKILSDFVSKSGKGVIL